MSAPTPSGHQVGDAFGSERSAQEKYYSYMLMKEKLTVSRDGGELAEILGARSEVEALKISILKKLNTSKYAESTAEFARLVDITGSEDHIGQADWLAKQIYAKKRGEMLMSEFSAGADAAIRNPRAAASAAAGTQSPAGAALGALSSAVAPRSS